MEKENGEVQAQSSTASYSHGPNPPETEPATITAVLAKPRQAVIDFLRKHTTYDMIPDSAKVVVIDTDLLAKNAFMALVEHDMTSAVLWDSRLQDYVGMLTVSDIVDMLRYFYKLASGTSHSISESLEKHSIREWRDLFRTSERPPNFISVDPEESIYEACRRMRQHRIHRLPILEKTNHNVVLHIITYSRVLGFLVRNLRGFPEILECTIFDLRMGTFANVCTATRDTPLNTVLNLLAEQRVSAIPIVDEHGVVIDVYSRSDVTHLARERLYNNLDITVNQALHHHHKTLNVLQLCRKTDTLKTVLERLAIANVHRLICVDSRRRVEGIVSASDILAHFIL